MGLLKGKCNSKEREGKGFSKLLSGKGRVHFSAKKCCVNVRKVMPKTNADGIVLKQKFMPIIYIKGSFMKHPCIAMCKAQPRHVQRFCVILVVGPQVGPYRKCCHVQRKASDDDF
jgi:hypothetical protein